MAFLETKGMLARLLAAENLIVEHNPSARTASFNVKTRVMTLPVWNTESEEVYNLFVSHEVGHALWTPVDFPDKLKESKVNATLANIIEDVRIEKLIQKKFPGLRKDYSLGYRALLEGNLFDTADKDINKLGFLDRMNLHFKVGAALLVPFSSEESEFLQTVSSVESYDDVISISEEIQGYVEEKSKLTGESPFSDADPIYVFSDEDGAPSMSVEEDDEESAEEDGEESAEKDDEESTEKDETPTPVMAGDAPAGELDSETQQALEAAMEGMVMLDGDTITYLNAPTYKPEMFVWPVTEVRNNMNLSIIMDLQSAHKADDHYTKFMNNARRDVNHMVQQFDMRKSAEVYARVQMNKTGMLNTGELHNYKLTDDIFLRQEISPAGKSHGMVMLLDWSQSMEGIAMDTIKQILVLVQFCRKIQIPFKVFTFTSGSPYKVSDATEHKSQPLDRAQIVEVLSSSYKSSQIDADMRNLFFIGFGGGLGRSYYKNYNPCCLLSMGGTPLINTMFLSLNILEKFKQQTKVDKISFVVVTDGDSAPVTVRGSDGGVGDTPYGGVMVRSTNGTVFKLDSDYRRSPGSVAQWITSRMPSVSVTNIFLGNYSSANHHHRNILGWDFGDKENVLEKAEFTKNNGLHFTTKNNWPLVALINPASFKVNDDEIEVAEGASASKVKTAFRKFLGKKQGSRKVLSAIVESFA